VDGVKTKATTRARRVVACSVVVVDCNLRASFSPLILTPATPAAALSINASLFPLYRATLGSWQFLGGRVIALSTSRNKAMILAIGRQRVT
jgi:hypothetical protein